MRGNGASRWKTLWLSDLFTFYVLRFTFRAAMNCRQLDFDWRRPEADTDMAGVDGRKIEVIYQRNEQARRYRLYLDRHGRPRVTIPRRGSRREAERFFEKHTAWLVERLRRFATLPGRHARWTAGTEIFFRGQLTPLEIAPEGGGWIVRLGTERLPALALPEGPATDVRRAVEAHLQELAQAELPSRVLELAALHASPVRRITIRNQATRWGSCSPRGTVSLNWRLVQTPVEVRDYIILHELMHLREMNHSRRFWACVASVCPGFEASELWLRKHAGAIL
jgi:predicted metal-dependent hydrolase